MQDLRPYQQVAVAWMLARPRCIYGDAAGSGKTPTAVAALARRGVRATLIVVPKSVMSHWEDEIALWWPAAEVARYLGPKRSVIFPEGIPYIALTTYETFRGDVDKLSRVPWGAIVFDEAHRLKNRNALVTKRANHFFTNARPHTVWFLTGTPVVNRPDEVWSLLHMIDRQRFTSYWRWVGEHMEIEHNRWIRPGTDIRIVQGLKPGHEEIVRQELQEFLLQRPLEALLPHLPPVTTTVVKVDLSPAERRVYTDLKRRHWAKLGDGTLMQTVNEISRMTRFRQIAEGMEATGTTKVDTAVEIARDLNPEQVVILTWSREACEAIAKKLDCEHIHGDVPVGWRTTAMARFVDGRDRVLVGTYGTLGEGVDGLQVARHLIQVSQEWTPSKNSQAIARLQRSGQRSAVNVYKLIATDTLDEYIEQVLSQKRSVIEALRTSHDREVLDGHLPAPGDHEVPRAVSGGAR